MKTYNFGKKSAVSATEKKTINKNINNELSDKGFAIAREVRQGLAKIDLRLTNNEELMINMAKTIDSLSKEIFSLKAYIDKLDKTPIIVEPIKTTEKPVVSKTDTATSEIDISEYLNKKLSDSEKAKITVSILECKTPEELKSLWGKCKSGQSSVYSGMFVAPRSLQALIDKVFGNGKPEQQKEQSMLEIQAEKLGIDKVTLRGIIEAVEQDGYNDELEDAIIEMLDDSGIEYDRDLAGRFCLALENL